jgi:CRISPR system Cascade subunit CasA
LVQLAALAFPADGSALPSTEDEWRKHLLALSQGQEEAWCLYVEDLKKPALLQTPFPSGEALAVLKNRADFPDDLDILVTAKSHDVKTGRAFQPRAEHWLFALLSLQTMQGFSGRDNYGIARMNSGFGNRPCVSLDPGSLGTRFRRDVVACQKARAELVKESSYRDEGGLGLLWLQEWGGKTSLSLSACDPYFIEICRRVRLQPGAPFFACYGSTSAPRIAAKELAGNTGDPWTPIRRPESSALTVPNDGFTYRLLHDLLFGEKYTPAAAQVIQDKDPKDLVLRCYALSRGQGKTEGLHQRSLPIPGKARRFLTRSADEREKLGKRSKQFIDDAKLAQKNILRFAVAKLLSAGKEGIHDKSGHFADALDDAIDQIFFESLWETLEKNDEEAQHEWRKKLKDLAWEQLQAAIESAPLPAARRYRAIAAAEGAFYGSLYKNFSELRPTAPTEGAAHE